MGVIMVGCVAFGLTISEAKPEMICLRTKGMLEATTIFSLGAVGQIHNQINEFVYLGGECQSQCRPVYRGWPAHTQRMVQHTEVHPRTVRPTEGFP